MFGDFYQLPSVEAEANHYAVVHSKVFAEICDGRMLELTRNYRAENDVDFAEFIADLRIKKNGGKPNFKTYGTAECRKSLCWTYKTRKAINYKWMHKEASDKNYIIINNFKYVLDYKSYVKTMTINKMDELKNNEEFELINLDNKI